MDTKEFKKLFGEIAKNHGFQSAFGGWMKDSEECIAVLDLQKSNFGNYFELNIKVYVQGMFGKTHIKSKELVKKETGNIFRRQPNEYKNVFDFDTSIEDRIRIELLTDFFRSFLVDFAEKALTKSGIIELANKGKIFLPPATKEELES